MRYYLLLTLLLSASTWASERQPLNTNSNVNYSNSGSQSGAAVYSKQTYKFKASAYSDGSIAGTGDRFYKVGPFAFGNTSRRKYHMAVMRLLARNPNPNPMLLEVICVGSKKWGKPAYRFCK